MSWAPDGWVCHSPIETGFYAGGNIRALKPIKANGRNCVLAARDNDKLSLYALGKGMEN